ncbi:MAG: group III truncated hemoglobin [Caulobacterales bacterium]|jgi:hemoglobin
MATPEERRLIAPGTAVGVTEEMIHTLVHAFYAKVRRDPALGPIFNRTIADWDHHLEKLCDFWSSVTLMTGRFKGAPMAAHARQPDIRATHFARWLHLFGETAAQTCPPEAAALFVAKAQMIGQSLQFGIAASRGELPARPPGIPASTMKEA